MAAQNPRIFLILGWILMAGATTVLVISVIENNMSKPHKDNNSVFEFGLFKFCITSGNERCYMWSEWEDKTGDQNDACDGFLSRKSGKYMLYLSNV
eukprot:m.11041 g.11041  ORF g.11041 m.11041 type:complete len:96 (-) comp4364_c0_seq2:2315-2602(-)